MFFTTDDPAWDQRPNNGPDPAFRAALFVWLMAAVNIVVFGCLSISFGVFSRLSKEEMEKMLPQLTAEQLSQIYPLLLPMAVVVFVLGFLPGVVYLITGFWVRRAHPTGIGLALLLVFTQLIVVGVVLLLDIAAAVVNRDPAAITVNTLTLGSYLAILIFTIRWLLRARGTAGHSNPESPEPWNDPTP
jgi:hypothetical protein